MSCGCGVKRRREKSKRSAMILLRLNSGSIRYLRWGVGVTDSEARMKMSMGQMDGGLVEGVARRRQWLLTR